MTVLAFTRDTFGRTPVQRGEQRALPKRATNPLPEEKERTAGRVPAAAGLRSGPRGAPGEVPGAG